MKQSAASGPGSLQILLEELTIPAIAELEVHVNLMRTLPKADFRGLILMSTDNWQNIKPLSFWSAEFLH